MGHMQRDFVALDQRGEEDKDHKESGQAAVRRSASIPQARANH